MRCPADSSELQLLLEELWKEILTEYLDRRTQSLSNNIITIFTVIIIISLIMTLLKYLLTFFVLSCVYELITK